MTEVIPSRMFPYKAFAVFPYPQQIVSGGPFVSGTLVDVTSALPLVTLQDGVDILNDLNGPWDNRHPGAFIKPGVFVQGTNFVSVMKV